MTTQTTKCKHPQDCDYPDCGTRSFPYLKKCYSQTTELKGATDGSPWLQFLNEYGQKEKLYMPQTTKPDARDWFLFGCIFLWSVFYGHQLAEEFICLIQ